MSVSSKIKLGISTEETLSSTPAAASAVVNQTAYDSIVWLHSATTPVASKCAYFLVTLVAGAATIDLTAVTGTNGAVFSAAGLKLRAFHLKNKGVAAMSVAKGATNGYEWAGTAPKLNLPIGGEDCQYLADGAPVIGSGAKNIDIAGTGTDTVEVSLLFG